MDYQTTHSPLKSLKSFLFFFILVIAAFMGFHFRFTLIPGVYFVFGSISVLIAVRLYGTVWGTVVAVAASIYTYFILQQPYGMVMFTAEALFVGVVLKRRELNLLLVDVLYWIFIGMPLGYVIHYVLIGLEAQLVTLIILKLVVNGILNTLIASLIITYLPVSKLLEDQVSRRKVSYYNALYIVFVGLVLIPSLLLLFIQSQHEFTEMKEKLAFQIEHQSIEITSQLAFWQQQHRNPLEELAAFVSNSNMEPSDELQRNVANLKKSIPQFIGMSVCNENGISIAMYPAKKPDGKSTIGLDFSDRDYYKNVRKSVKPFITPVFKGKTAVLQPVIAMTVPVVTNGRFNGIVSGALDLTYIAKVLRISGAGEHLYVTVVDQNGIVISSTRQDVRVMTDFYRDRKGEKRKINPEIYQWFPAQNLEKHEAIEWGNSFYVMEKSIEGVPWTAIVEVPVGPYQKYLTVFYIRILVLMLGLVIIAVALSTLFSRRMTQPLSRLASFTTNLPDRLYSGEPIVWEPQSNILEINSLKKSFRSMADIVQQNFKDIQTQYHYSNALNRVAGVVASEDDTRTILAKVNSIVAEALDVDFSLIYDVNFEQGKIQALSEWYNRRNPERLTSVHSFDIEAFAGCNQYVLKYKSWVESHYDKVACCLEDDMLAPFIHGELGVKSLIWYPFSFHDGGYYVLAFNQIQNRREWIGEELNFVSAVAKQVEIAVQKINFLNAIWEEKERAQVTLHSIGDAVITTDAEGIVVYMNPVAEGLTGWGNVEARGLPLMQVFKIVNEETGLHVENPVDKCLSEGCIVGLANHTVLIHRNGQRFAIEDSAAPIRNKEGSIIGVVLVFHDVSEKRQLVNQLTQLAYHDPLTQLPNRILFHDRLSHSLAKAQRNGEMIAVLFLDLDRFKLVNDMMGHVMGDSLLKEVALRLAKCIRQSDTIARLGGDEFTLIIPGIQHAEDAAIIAQKILYALQSPFVVSNNEFHVSASLGIAVYPGDGEDAESLMRHADMAMYRAKEQGLNSYRFFTPELNIKILDRLAMENCLRKSLENMDFVVYYQPQVNAITGQIDGMEALIRWKHPERGIVSPKEFIPLAEDSGLILPIGEWVLRTACSQSKAWQEAGYSPIRVTVNISAHQFRRKDLPQLVAQVLRETGLEPHLLEVEITESVTMNDADYTAQVLRDLQDMGVQIAIDDFGTGHSSLSYLKRFPINTLKIDRSFMRDVIENSGDSAIVTTIIAMAKNMNMNVIAEGVETFEQVRFLIEKDCEKMQGYYFSKPVPPEEFEKLIQKNLLP